MKSILALALIALVTACAGPKRVPVAETMGGGGAAPAEKSKPAEEPKKNPK